MPSEPPETNKIRRSSFSRALVIALGTLLVILIVLSLGRTFIASRILEFYLARKGVASSIEISELDWGAIDARVRLGPSLSPDLTIERLHVWLGGDSFVPDVQSIEMTKPSLRVSFDGAHFSFGALRQLIEALSSDANERNGNSGPSKGRANGERQPPLGIQFEDANLLVQTPAGNVNIAGTGNISGTRIRVLHATIDPAHLRSAQFAADILAGRIDGRMSGKGSDIQIAIGARNIDRRGAWQIAQTSGSVTLNDLVWQGDRIAFASGTIDAEAHGVGGKKLAAKDAALKLALGNSRGTFAGGSVDMILSLAGRITLSNATFANVSAGTASFGLQTASARAGYAHANWGFSGPLRIDASLQSAKSRSGRQTIAINTATAHLQGNAAWQAGQTSADMTGALSTDGSIAGGETWVSDIPLAGSDPQIRRALLRVLDGFALDAPAFQVISGDARKSLVLTKPVRLESRSGAKVTLSQTNGATTAVVNDGRWSGSFDLAINGGGLPDIDLTAASFAMRPDADGSPLKAVLGVRAKGNLSQFHGLSVNARGNLTSRDGVLRFVSGDCAQIGLRAYSANGETSLSHLRAQLCPIPEQPMLTAGDDGWHLGGQWAGAHLRLDQAKLGAASPKGRIAVSGNARGLTRGSVETAKLTVSDMAAAARFAPVDANAAMALANGEWHGTISLSTTESHHHIADIAVRHAMASGAGSATIDAKGVTFAPGGLQPETLSPLLARITQMRGNVDFTGQLAWTADSQTGHGELTAHDVAFTGPLGAMTGANLDMRFTSLSPLVTAPHQTFAAAHADWLLPLSDIAAQFQLAPDAIRLESAHALTGGGQIGLAPLSLPYAGNSTAHGALELAHVNLNALIAASNLQDKVTLDVPVTGTVPFSLGPQGVRLQNGKIQSDSEGRLAIPRSVWTGTGEGTSDAIHDFAYQAMEHLAIDELDATLNSQPGGRLGILFHIKGRNDPATGKEARIGIVALLQGKALQQPIPLPKGTPVDLTLETSLNFDELLNTYRGIFSGGGFSGVTLEEPKTGAHP